MKFRELLLPFALAMITAAVVQHFFFKPSPNNLSQKAPQSGQQLSVPSHESAGGSMNPS
ncbi:hypothetical protein HOL34_00665, partial [bacterium]|nr:hypothetical protein [bacterium]